MIINKLRSASRFIKSRFQNMSNYSKLLDTYSLLLWKWNNVIFQFSPIYVFINLNYSVPLVNEGLHSMSRPRMQWPSFLFLASTKSRSSFAALSTSSTVLLYIVRPPNFISGHKSKNKSCHFTKETEADNHCVYLLMVG